MPRDGYTSLPGAQEPTHSETEDEMERAFESDDDELDTMPLAQLSASRTTVSRAPSQAPEGAYDFEREYDRPPPGSPPPSLAPTAVGNSNGIIPSPSSILRPNNSDQRPKPSFFRRAAGALLPQYYARVPTHDTEVVGSGIENDGVFSNVSARPTPPRTVQDEHGDVHVMPEDAQNDAPPSYTAAQADAAPPYWETTVHAPAFGGADDLLIEGLPAGSVFSFAWNFLISISFQFVGFMLTYLLHTSHAAKYGSRAGLGVTLIQYGLFSRATGGGSDGFGDDTDGEVGATTFPTQTNRLARRGSFSIYPRIWMASGTTSDDQSNRVALFSNDVMHDWVSFILMTVGWILFLSSVFGFIRVKRWERSIRTPTPEPIATPEAVQREEELRTRLADVFGLAVLTRAEAENQEQPMANDGPAAIAARDEAIRRQLGATGFI